MTITPIQEENLDAEALEKINDEMMDEEIKENLIKRYQSTQKITQRQEKKKEETRKLHIPKRLVWKLNQQKHHRAALMLKFQNDRYNDLLSGKPSLNEDLNKPFVISSKHGNVLKINYSRKKFKTLEDGTTIEDNRVIDDEIHEVFLGNANVNFEKEKCKLNNLLFQSNENKDNIAWTWFEKKHKSR